MLATAVVVVSAGGCGTPSAQDQARDQLRSAVGSAETALVRVLRHGDVNEASVRSVLGNRPVAVEVAPTGDEVSVHVVFTERAQRGGGLSYQSWTSRACVLFTGGAGSDTIRAVDEPCPAALLGDQEATNEVLDVTR